MSGRFGVPSAALGGVALCFALSGGIAAAASDLPTLGRGIAVAHLQGGYGTVIVQPASGSPVAAVELWFRAPSVGFGAKPLPSVARLAAQTVASSDPLVGSSLGDRVNAVGGKLAINAYGDSVSVAALVPAAAARDIVKSMTIAFFSPVVTDAGFTSAVRDVTMEALFAGFDPEAVVRDAVFEALFKSGPEHYSPLGSTKDVGAVTIDDVRSFAQRAFRAQNAVLVISGAVDQSVATAASKGRPGAGTEPPAFESPAPSAVAASPEPVKRSFDEPAGGIGWVGPAIAQQDEATAMDFIADYLFRPDSGVVSRVVADAYPGAFVSGQFITLHDPGVLFVAYGGGDPTALSTLVDKSLASMKVPLDPIVFARARDAFMYHLLSDLQTPTELADNFGWYSVEGNAEYAPGADGASGAYFKAAQMLTPASVASVAEKYLAGPSASALLQPDAKKPAPAKGSAS
jgi:predicted Zn-dependent peptidase